MFNIKIEKSEFILGEKFPDLSDNVVCYYNKKDTIKNNVIYGDIYCASEILNFVRNSNQTFKLIFHNSDWNCPDDLPSNCTVYSQNVHKSNKSINVHSLPIGLENTKWFTHINKIEKIYNKNCNTIPSKLCYCNFNPETNKNVRIPAANDMAKKSDYITYDMHHNGYNFDAYLDNIVNHFFIFSPPGNGIDCHRAWEALYLNRVPIVYDVYKSDLFEDLPVVVVKDSTEISKQFLLEQKEIILSKTYNFEKLKFNYWKNKIKNAKY